MEVSLGAERLGPARYRGQGRAEAQCQENHHSLLPTFSSACRGAPLFLQPASVGPCTLLCLLSGAWWAPSVCMGSCSRLNRGLPPPPAPFAPAYQHLGQELSQGLMGVRGNLAHLAQLALSQLSVHVPYLPPLQSDYLCCTGSQVAWSLPSCCRPLTISHGSSSGQLGHRVTHGSHLPQAT